MRKQLLAGSEVVETASGRIEVAIEGEGPPVLPIHGGHMKLGQRDRVKREVRRFLAEKAIFLCLQAMFKIYWRRY